MSRTPILKLRPGLPKEFAELFRAGVTIEDACERLQVPLSCFKEWRRWGSIKRPDGTPPAEPYGSFAHEVNLALHDFEGALVDIVLRQGEDAKYVHDVVETRDDGTKTVLHKRGEIILAPTGYVARRGDWRAIHAVLQARFPKTYTPQWRVIIQRELERAITAIEREFASEPEILHRAVQAIALSEEAEGDGADVPGAPPPEVVEAAVKASKKKRGDAKPPPRTEH